MTSRYHVVLAAVVNSTVNLANNDCEIAVSIDEKLCLWNIVFLGETVKKRPCWDSPTATRDLLINCDSPTADLTPASLRRS